LELLSGTDGQEIAVKRLALNTVHGIAEFRNEIQFYSEAPAHKFGSVLGVLLTRR
jgi:hypothetical protein